MTEILFIKTSSLGDVIHHMPAMTDARRWLPQARFTWLVEEPYVPLVRLHPAVDDVIAVASRRWRWRPAMPATGREVGGFVRALRRREFTEIIDTQGLLRSALIARLARGRRHGYDATSIRERAAAYIYERKYEVARDLHAITRNRMLTGRALGYLPDQALDYGLDRAKLTAQTTERYALLLHATAQRAKEWPEENWIALARGLGDRGLALVLPWGSAREHARAARIAAAAPHTYVADPQPLDGMARLVAGAAFVAGVDTGLVHLAAALAVPLVAIFTGSAPTLTGPMGPGQIDIVGDHGAMPGVDDVAAAIARVT
ncbi:MAG: lipopolysaccharide heptosyltransferase I [Proteobacteria bacterium]|nr:lipopolysaccharide heptosyltransferase I [Pseudomonadota bacterium]